MQRYLGTLLSLMLFAIRLIPLSLNNMPIPVTFTDRQLLATQALMDANLSLIDSSEDYHPIIHEFLLAFFFDIHPDYDEIQDTEPIGVFVMLSSLEPRSKGNFQPARTIVSWLGRVQWLMRLTATVDIKEKMKTTAHDDNAVL
jgi:hypothetical protein